MCHHDAKHIFLPPLRTSPRNKWGSLTLASISIPVNPWEMPSYIWHVDQLLIAAITDDHKLSGLKWYKFFFFFWSSRGQKSKMNLLRAKIKEGTELVPSGGSRGEASLCLLKFLSDHGILGSWLYHSPHSDSVLTSPSLPLTKIFGNIQDPPRQSTVISPSQDP